MFIRTYLIVPFRPRSNYSYGVCTSLMFMHYIRVTIRNIVDIVITPRRSYHNIDNDSIVIIWSPLLTWHLRRYEYEMIYVVRDDCSCRL